MQTSKNHFEAKVIFNDETHPPDVRTEFYTYRGDAAAGLAGRGICAGDAGTLRSHPTVVKVLCLLVGCADLQHGPAWREEQYHSQVNSCEVNWKMLRR